MVKALLMNPPIITISPSNGVLHLSHLLHSEGIINRDVMLNDGKHIVTRRHLELSMLSDLSKP